MPCALHCLSPLLNSTPRIANDGPWVDIMGSRIQVMGSWFRAEDQADQAKLKTLNPAGPQFRVWEC